MLDGIKSQMIINSVFRHIKQKKKLKIALYNKILLKRLNITIKDLEDFKFLKEFNSKFNTNIEDINISIIDLTQKNLNNDIFEYLRNIRPTQTKELLLSNNNISDIKTPKNVNFEKSEKPLSNNNKLTDINSPNQINLEELKELTFYQNEISDINALNNLKFNKLEKLSFAILKF